MKRYSIVMSLKKTLNTVQKETIFRIAIVVWTTVNLTKTNKSPEENIISFSQYTVADFL
jgi:hypothetical protein